MKATLTCDEIPVSSKIFRNWKEIVLFHTLMKKSMYVCIQAREGAALRETLQAEREASCAEQEALRALIQKLENQINEKPQPCPVISEKEVEERKRAEEKAAQEILQLTEVGLQT